MEDSAPPGALEKRGETAFGPAHERKGSGIPRKKVSFSLGETFPRKAPTL